MTNRIPLVDLAWQHERVSEKIERGFSEVIDNTSFILGSQVAAFEAQFAAFSGVRRCVGVSNGGDAIELALRALGVGPGDEVILPANTFIATALAVVRSGAEPVLADVDPVHLLLDPGQVVERITDRTSAVIPVHLFGQMAPMAQLRELADDLGLAVVEDAAQSHGATQHGHGTGEFGMAAATSFYPGKNLGAYGDAGAVLTNDDAVADQLELLRNYGSDVKYAHPTQGFNARLDTLQAVVLRAKLDHLDEWNEMRREAARRYDQLLGDLDEVRLPGARAENEHVWHLYVIRLRRRDEIMALLQDEGIEVGVHYPVPIHLQGAFEHLGHAVGDFPVTEKAAKTMLSLPLFPGITREQQERIARVLRSAVGLS